MTGLVCELADAGGLGELVGRLMKVKINVGMALDVAMSKMGEVVDVEVASCLKLWVRSPCWVDSHEIATTALVMTTFSL